MNGQEQTLRKSDRLFGWEHRTVSKGRLEGIAESEVIYGPYALVVTPEMWQRLTSYIKGRPLKAHLEEMLQGTVVLSTHIDAPLLVATRGGDFVMTIGQDLSIGYYSRNVTSMLRKEARLPSTPNPRRP